MNNVPIVIIADECIDVQMKTDNLTNEAEQSMLSPVTPEEDAVAGISLICCFIELNNSVCPVTIYYDHGILISIDYRKVFIGGKEVELFRKEFEILSLLTSKNTRVLTY